MHITAVDLEINNGGACTLITNAAATSAQSPAVAAPTNGSAALPAIVFVTPDNTCYCRKGTNPTAVNDGTDQKLIANVQYRVQLPIGEKMAFISTAGGTVHWAPSS